jgi:hypothetical protein
MTVNNWKNKEFVIAGLDPAIHGMSQIRRRALDARVTPGHDGNVLIYNRSCHARA